MSAEEKLVKINIKNTFLVLFQGIKVLLTIGANSIYEIRKEVSDTLNSATWG